MHPLSVQEDCTPTRPLSTIIQAWNARLPLLFKVRSSTWFIVAVSTFAIFTGSFFSSLVIPVIPTALVERVGLVSDQVQQLNSVLVSIHAATLCVISPIAGYLADRIGSRQWPLLFGLVLDTIGTALLCVGNSLALWISGRIIQGAATAFVETASMALVVDTVSDDHLGRYLGYTSIGLAIGTTAGPLLGGIMYEHGGYYSVFILAFVLIGIDGILRVSVIDKRRASRWIGETEVESPQLDSEKSYRNHGEQGPGIQVEEQTLEPTQSAPNKRNLPATIILLSNPRILTGIFGYWVTAFLWTSFDTVLPLYVHESFGWNQMGGGLIFLPLSLPIFFDPVVGAICDRWPRSPRYISSGALVCAVPSLVCLRFVSRNEISEKVLLCVLLGIVGFLLCGVQVPALLDVNLAVKDKEQKHAAIFGKGGAVSQAYGLCVSSYAIGGIVGPLFAGFVRQSAGWSTMAWAMAIVSGVSSVPTLLLLGGWIGMREREI